jgi:hypothetical protein
VLVTRTIRWVFGFGLRSGLVCGRGCVLGYGGLVKAVGWNNGAGDFLPLGQWQSMVDEGGSVTV